MKFLPLILFVIGAFNVVLDVAFTFVPSRHVWDGYYRGLSLSAALLLLAVVAALINIDHNTRHN